jgi:hypothetical protein
MNGKSLVNWMQEQLGIYALVRVFGAARSSSWYWRVVARVVS